MHPHWGVPWNSGVLIHTGCVYYVGGEVYSLETYVPVVSDFNGWVIVLSKCPRYEWSNKRWLPDRNKTKHSDLSVYCYWFWPSTRGRKAQMGEMIRVYFRDSRKTVDLFISSHVRYFDQQDQIKCEETGVQKDRQMVDGFLSLTPPTKLCRMGPSFVMAHRL